jgi:CRP/FNR family transcriptional regulator
LNIKEAVERLTFFSNLSNHQREELVNISFVKKYESNTLLYYEKTSNSKLLFLVEGLARAYKMDKHNNEIFLYYIYPNRIVSEISSLSDTDLTSYSNIAFVENSQILSIDYLMFQEKFLKKGLLCLELANEVIEQSKRLQDLVNREFVFDSVAKVAMMLSSDIRMFNKLKRYDVSLVLNIQPSTLSRVLNRLKRKGIVDIDHGEVIILNRKALETIYEGLEV